MDEGSSRPSVSSVQDGREAVLDADARPLERAAINQRGSPPGDTFLDDQLFNYLSAIADYQGHGAMQKPFDHGENWPALLITVEAASAHQAVFHPCDQ